MNKTSVDTDLFYASAEITVGEYSPYILITPNV